MSNPYATWNDSVIAEFRANHGTVARFGDSLVLIHHVGARTGVERIAPVMSIRLDLNTWLVAASKAGAPDNPAWFHNLLAHPDVSIETPEGTVAVHAERLEGEARAEAWSRFTAASPGFRAYEQKTTREIPVIALRRIASAAS